MPREHSGHIKHHLPRIQEMTLHKNITKYQNITNTKIRLIIFFEIEDGESLYSQKKQDWELIVAQIMYSLLPNADLN